MNPLVILYSLCGPFLALLVEYAFPYPYIVEELFKVFVVKFTKASAKTYIFAGVAFALTETVLYSFDINLSGKISLFFVRFLTSSILHSTTFLIIYYFSQKKKWLIIIGFLAAVLIHYLYNRYIPIYR